MKLVDYLKTRSVNTNALLKKEAEILGLPWPLKTGWVELYGGIEVSKSTEERLRKALLAKGRGHEDLFGAA